MGTDHSRIVWTVVFRCYTSHVSPAFALPLDSSWRMDGLWLVSFLSLNSGSSRVTSWQKWSLKLLSNIVNWNEQIHTYLILCHNFKTLRNLVLLRQKKGFNEILLDHIDVANITACSVDKIWCICQSNLSKLSTQKHYLSHTSFLCIFYCNHNVYHSGPGSMWPAALTYFIRLFRHYTQVRNPLWLRTKGF